MRTLALPFLLISVLFAITHADETPAPLSQRTSFSIPLAKLSVSFGTLNGRFEKVRVTDLRADEIEEIGMQEDAQIKLSKHGKETKVFNESPTTAHLITDFEAEVLGEVAQSLAATLKILERDVQRGNWDRLLYLDAYFPRFLRGYYYLYCGALNSMNAMPRKAYVPEESYDVSLRSKKSEERVRRWRDNPEQSVRLRIAAKELSHQIKQWRKRELRRSERSGMRSGEKFEKAFTLFIRVYFNRFPLPDLPPDGSHF